jgi:hypothetical protein
MTAGVADTAQTTLLVMTMAAVDMARMIRQATTVVARVAGAALTIALGMTVAAGVAVIADGAEDAIPNVSSSRS